MAITITPHPKRVRVRFNGRTLVDTTKALALHEGGYQPVLYLPRADADMTLLERSAHTTHCPHKGEANYFSHEGRRPHRGQRGLDLRDTA